MLVPRQNNQSHPSNNTVAGTYHQSFTAHPLKAKEEESTHNTPVTKLVYN
jgi:hypothetical protein